MTVYCIEIKTGDTWAPKDICHCKIPTEEKANARMSEMISSEGQDPSTVRVSVDTPGAAMNPIDMSIEGNSVPE